ncbi:MAG: PepSY domain-containing protein [Rhizomicrobium sp.]
MSGTRALGAWRFVHTWTSLVCTAFLLMLCLTGLPLIFQDELEDAFPGGPVPAAAVAGKPVLPLDRFAQAARGRYPQDALRSLFLDDDAPQVFAVLAPSIDAPNAANHVLTMDAHTGVVLRDSLHPAGGGADAFLTFARILHAELFLGLPGDLFLAVMALLFLAALASGVVLYAPFARRAPFGTVRNAGSNRLLWLDLHNVLGIVVAAWLLVVGFTGLMNTLSTPLFGLWEITDVAKMLAGYDKLPVVTPTTSIQSAVDAALHAMPGSAVSSITMPTHVDGSPLHYVVWTKGASPLTARLMTPVLVDARTGRVARVVALPAYLRAVEISRPLHFGDYGGLPLKILWALFDMVAIAVLGSGLYLWAAKRFGRSVRTDATGELVPAPAE